MTRRQLGQVVMFLSCVGGANVWLAIAAGLLAAVATSEGRLDCFAFSAMSGLYFAASAVALFRLGRQLRDNK